MIKNLIEKFTNKFTETIFLKDTSELKKQIEALQELLVHYPNNEKLKKELKMCEIGLKGEEEIKFELGNANIGMYVLHDVNIEYKDLKAQIDYIIITPAYTYFVECKNLVGNITVDSNGNFSREIYYGKKKVNEGMYSPLSQAQRHVEIFKKIWCDRNTKIIDKLIRRNYLDVWYKPLVVMANSKNILNLRFAPKNYKNNVIKSDRLVEYLKNDLAKCDKDMLLDKDGMYNLAMSFILNYNKDKNIDYKQKYAEKFLRENASEKIENKPEVEQLREKLIEFRKERAKEKGLPPFYVFNNMELEELLKLMPKSKEELMKSNVLSAVKVKVHGDEIIKIIQEVLEQ